MPVSIIQHGFWSPHHLSYPNPDGVNSKSPLPSTSTAMFVISHCTCELFCLLHVYIMHGACVFSEILKFQNYAQTIPMKFGSNFCFFGNFVENKILC